MPDMSAVSLGIGGVVEAGSGTVSTDRANDFATLSTATALDPTTTLAEIGLIFTQATNGNVNQSALTQHLQTITDPKERVEIILSIIHDPDAKPHADSDNELSLTDSLEQVLKRHKGNTQFSAEIRQAIEQLQSTQNHQDEGPYLAERMENRRLRDSDLIDIKDHPGVVGQVDESPHWKKHTSADNRAVYMRTDEQPHVAKTGWFAGLFDTATAFQYIKEQFPEVTVPNVIALLRDGPHGCCLMSKVEFASKANAVNYQVTLSEHENSIENWKALKAEVTTIGQHLAHNDFISDLHGDNWGITRPGLNNLMKGEPVGLEHVVIWDPTN